MRTRIVLYEGQRIILQQCSVCGECEFRVGVLVWPTEQFLSLHAARVAHAVELETRDVLSFVSVPVLLTQRVCSETCARLMRRSWIDEMIEQLQDATLRFLPGIATERGV